MCEDEIGRGCVKFRGTQLPKTNVWEPGSVMLRNGVAQEVKSCRQKMVSGETPLVCQIRRHRRYGTGKAYICRCIGISQTAQLRVEQRKDETMIKFNKPMTMIILFVISLILGGCGRSYFIKGRVVSLSESRGLGSFIGEIHNQAVPQGAKSIQKAKIKLVHELDKNRMPVDGTVWQKSTETNNEGYFEIHDYATPGRMNLVGLTVEASGYKPAFTTYWDTTDEKPQVFFIMLAPNENEANTK